MEKRCEFIPGQRRRYCANGVIEWDADRPRKALARTKWSAKQ